MKCTVTYTVSELTTKLLVEKTQQVIHNTVPIRQMVLKGDATWSENDSYRLVRDYIAFFPAVSYQVQVTTINNTVDICAFDMRREPGRRMVSEHLLRLNGDTVEIADLAVGFGRERSLLWLTDIINILDSLPITREGEKV
jgi:hypothetical protein